MGLMDSVASGFHEDDFSQNHGGYDVIGNWSHLGQGSRIIKPLFEMNSSYHGS